MTIPSNAELAAADPDVWIEVDGELVPNYDATLSDFSEGDVVTGKVVRIDKDEILVDIGYKSEGVIPVNELSIRRSVNPEDEVAIGDEVDALVLQKEDQDGRLILSKKRARFEKAWKRIEAAAESGETVEGQVIEVVKGGLIIDLGVRGFLPASLVDIRRVQDLDEFRGQALRCKVIELNRSRNNVVLSRRAVLEDERREVRQRILDELEPGAVVEGVISNIVDFGAFVDLDGIDGLIHISELSWTHVNHPSEILEIGSTVKVKVLDIDRDRQRISLGLKQTQADPWQRVLESYQQDDDVHGRVTKVVTFGAFVEILTGVEGLVHISELAAHHVENPREVVVPGQHVIVKIIDIDADRRRLSLSMKRVDEHDQVLPPIALVPGDKPFLADEIAAEEAGLPMPNLGLSSEVFADDLSPEEEAKLQALYADVTPGMEPLAALMAETRAAEAVAEEIVAEAVEDEIVAEAVAEEIVAEAVVDEIVAEAVAEEIVAEAVAEEIVAEAVAEEIVAEAVAEEIEALEVAEEVLARAPDGDPVAEAIAEEIVAEAVAEEIVAEIVAEEIVAEAVAEEIVAEAVAEEIVAEALPRRSSPVAEEIVAEAVAEEIIAEVVAEEIVEEAVAEEIVAEIVAEEIVADAEEDGGKKKS